MFDIFGIDEVGRSSANLFIELRKDEKLFSEKPFYCKENINGFLYFLSWYLMNLLLYTLKIMYNTF